VTAGPGSSSAAGEVHDLTVPDGAGPVRVDRVAADLTGISRSYVQKLIGEGRLTCDGRPLRASEPVAPGTRLRLVVPPPEPALPRPAPEIPVTMVYEDRDLLIVDKPSGLVVHPAAGHSDDTLVNALLGRHDSDAFGGIAGVRRPGIVHRLDRDTSGLLMVARHDAAQASLMAQLKARRVKKTYLALVHGSVAAGAGRIEAPIGRDPGRRTRMAVLASGRPAATGYRVRERFGQWTLLELDLITGRTHQIRVHLSAIGHPIVGDALYGGVHRRVPGDLRAISRLDRPFLHAARLVFKHPRDGRPMEFTSELPEDLQRVLDELRGDT
jgi:23S rRNA pseudouridine1911/1915/1917 synthase